MLGDNGVVNWISPFVGQNELPEPAVPEWALVILGQLSWTLLMHWTCPKCSELGLERVRGIEPPFSAWEADVLPLNYTRGLGQGNPAQAAGARHQRTAAIQTGRTPSGAGSREAGSNAIEWRAWDIRSRLAGRWS